MLLDKNTKLICGLLFYFGIFVHVLLVLYLFSFCFHFCFWFVSVWGQKGENMKLGREVERSWKELGDWKI